MNPTTFPPPAARLPEVAAPAGSSGALNNVLAIAGVVIKEMYRRKDFYVLFVLTALLTLVMGSVTFFNQENIARYLKEICLFLIWVASLVIAITTTARQIPAEREQRTMFPLLAKPVTRHHVVVGKFLGCWFAAGLSLVLFYTFFGIVAGLKEHEWPVLNFFQAAVLHWFMLGIVCAMTMLGSVVFAAPSSNNTITLVISVGILLLGRHLNKVALKMEEPGQTLLYAAYFVLPHLEIFDVRDLIVHNWELIPWGIWAAALAYAVVYSAIFLVGACLVFRRKAIN